MVNMGLSKHGWTYINIDDGWQGYRTANNYALQPNTKFSDFKGMIDEIHNKGLKLGLYSTPWITSYAGFGGDLRILKMALCLIQLSTTKDHSDISVNIVLKNRMPFKWHNGG